jgi:uncharacterized protein YcfJ
MEQRCERAHDTRKKSIGFDISYRLGDQEGTVRTNSDPGNAFPCATELGDR